MSTAAISMQTQASYVILVLIVCCVIAKKNTDLTEFLNTEELHLKKLDIVCPYKKLEKKHVESLWMKEEDKNKILACLIRYLKQDPSEGNLWTIVGTLYDQKGKKFTSQANTCFKQASKLSGKFPNFIKDWHFIGPFVIGKTEFDGDPLEAFGGIYNVSKYRLENGLSYPSELMPNGQVHWSTIKAAASDKNVRVAPNVHWNDLVNSLGSLGITEWQGWVVGELPVNQDSHMLVQCSGISTVYVDHAPLTGDVYHRNQFKFPLSLSRGIHLVAVKLRAKVQALFQCLFQQPPKDNFEIIAPSFQPDLYDGYLFSHYLSIPVVNYRSDKWVRLIKATLLEQSEGELIEAEIIDNNFSISPGQIKLIPIRLSSQSDRITQVCKDINVNLVLKTSEGVGTLAMTLRCRKKRDSFLFTFLDHDGSVQHAAAIEPIGACPNNLCPVLLTLHGTTVPPQNQADSYKRMIRGEFQFGLKGMWLLAPTRHGAHNWEGPGALTAMTSLQTLADLTQHHSWVVHKADSYHVLFEGHSMGGHGAWHLATHFPDRAIGLVALAGWIKKEEYGDSNLFFRHDIATSHTDASIKAVLEACIGENDADRHVTNLWGISVLVRIGAKDRTVHPFFSRRMYRLLQEQGNNVTYAEIEEQEHWWWDTWETNDGGVVNDKQMRTFADDCLSALYSVHHDSKEGICTSRNCDDEMGSTGHIWSRSQRGGHEVAELVTINPAFGEGLRGVRVLRQTVPFRLSNIKINITENDAYLVTTNVERFKIKMAPNRPVEWMEKRLFIDGCPEINKTNLQHVLSEDSAHFCKISGCWDMCLDAVHTEKQRGPRTLGPARRIAELSFVIVAGTLGDPEVTQKILISAVYIANLFLLTSDAVAHVVNDVDISSQQLENMNIILIGGLKENKFTKPYMDKIPIAVEDNILHLGECHFRGPGTGAMTLAPNGPDHLAMILFGLSSDSLAAVVNLATPTIPPMARSPFSNLLPDFAILGPEYPRKGPGGFLCAGFWGNRWELRQELISCACMTP